MTERIVITGCTRGLGLALTRGFIEAGHEVYGCGRSEEALAELRREFPDPHYFTAVDVSEDGSVARFATEVLSRGGPPDRIINNAAIINESAPIWQINDRAIDDILSINVKGVISVLRHFLPTMNEAGRGVVVNISSGWGRSTSPGVASYCATKWAVEGLSQAVSQEVSADVSIIALNPGIIDTSMLRSCFGDAAGAHDDPATWARRAVPMILELGPGDNGARLSVP